MSRDFAWYGLEAAMIELERALPERWGLERVARVPRTGQWRATAEYRGGRIEGAARDTMAAAVRSLRDEVQRQFPDVAA